MKIKQLLEASDYRNLTCPNCGGAGHFADDEPEDDDDYCTMCAGHGELALKGKDCGACGGEGHFGDDEEVMDDEYCYDCAGTGQVGSKGQPVYNPDLHGQIDIKPPPGR